jgi:hypothetical protein
MAKTWNTDGSIVKMTAAADVLNGSLNIAIIIYEADVVGHIAVLSAAPHAAKDVLPKLIAGADKRDVVYLPDSRLTDLTIDSIESGTIIIIPAPNSSMVP